MKQRVLFFLCIFVGGSGLAIAQGKTVTNADLEKFKQKRLRAEQGLKEYYEKLGLSEEDVAKKRAEETKEREELSARLRASRLEQERLDAEARQREIDAAGSTVNVVVQSGGAQYPGFYTYSTPYYSQGRRWYRPSRYPVTWRATPMGMIYEPGSLPASIWNPRSQRRPPLREARRPR